MKIEFFQPPHGHVIYVDHLGSDQRIVDAARVSYAGVSKGEEADKKLLNYLYRMRHTSPFEQCSITFDIKMPIFLMRQFVRHRTVRLNEISGRYAELPNQFFLPKSWRVQNTTGNKQGSAIDLERPLEWHDEQTARARAVYDFAHLTYLYMLTEGVALEQARMILPVGIYTHIMVNIDLNNLTKFLHLRCDGHAQSEMQDIAFAMLQIFSTLFPWTAAAFQRYKMVVVNNENSGH